jgi:hypothetical protein
MGNEAKQMSLFDLDTSFGRMYLEHSHPQTEKISKQSLKKPQELLTVPYLYLDLREGYGNLLGAFWEVNSPLLGEFSMLNTGVLPKDVKESFLSQILEEAPHPKYYLSKTSCLGILRRAKSRGKELPKQLKTALEIQAGVIAVENAPMIEINKELKSYHINQRNEGIDLNGISGALMATRNMQMQTFITEPMLCLNDQGGNRMDVTENITSTLRASMGGNLPIVMGRQQGDGIRDNNIPLVSNPIAYSLDSKDSNSMKSSNPTSGCRVTETARTIDTTNPDPSKNQGGIAIVQDSYCIASNIINRQDKNGGNGCGFQENISYTLTTSDIHAVCSIPKTYQNIVGALCVGDEKGIGNQYVSQDKCIVDYKRMMLGDESNDNEERREKSAAAIKLVRRLTPLECERLQGFPDGWTDILKAADSPRYKALGNSVAVPCVDFILRGIAYFLRKFKQEKEDS